jgi:hypothetical protein
MSLNGSNYIQILNVRADRELLNTYREENYIFKVCSGEWFRVR